MKKIILLIDGLGSGGAQTQLITLASGLKQLGYDVRIVCYHVETFNNARLNELGLYQVVLQRGSLGGGKVIFPLRLKLFFRQEKPHAVIAFLVGPCFYAELASLISRSYKLVVSERFMTNEPPLLRERFYYLFHLLADHLVVNSRHQTDRAKRSFPWIKKKILTISNGYPEIPDVGPATVYGREEVIRFVVVSSLAEKKNPLRLIRALGRLYQAHKNISCVWVGRVRAVGESSEIDEQLYRACIDEIVRWDLSDVIEFAGEQTEVGSYYRSADWLVHPSLKEGFPNVICEAISYGLPVLASNVGDHKFMVHDSSCGYLFDPEDSESIFNSMKKAVECSEQVYCELSANCLSFFERELRSQRLASRYAQLL